MPVSIDVLSIHLDYTAWASRRLVEAAATLTEGELTRDFGTSDHSVLGTLVHTYAADRVWLGRVTGADPQIFLDPERDMEMRVLEQDWPALMARWREWLAARRADSLQEEIAYKDMKGNPWKTPVWQIILHLVNHATHHRGQVAGFLRAMGHTPPPLDLVAFYRASGI